MLSLQRFHGAPRLSRFLKVTASRTCSTKSTTKKKLAKGGPSFQEFLAASNVGSSSLKSVKRTPDEAHPYITEKMTRGDGLKVFLDVFGCQMNVSDAEVVWSVLESKGYQRTLVKSEADVLLVVTCSIREGAEAKVWNSLLNVQNRIQFGQFKKSMVVGLLGCMAERLKDKMLSTPQKLVDLVAGPDAYRDLPRLLAITKFSSESSASKQQAINVLLSMDETYADVRPSRLNKDSVTGFVSIQRGCDNMCSYCIVPFTRGRERSRPVGTILDEVRALSDQGVKEVTLLGQNVNSYRDVSEESLALFGDSKAAAMAKGFKTIYKPKMGGLRFADLLHKVAEVNPEIRIRFTSPHPKDFPDEVLELIKTTPNICNHLHLPAQCGSTRILEAMRRGYTRESYLELVEHIKEVIPDVRFSGDMIAGFCDETEEEFKQTLSLIETVRYGTLFCYPYSMREKTHAHRKLVDNVPEDVKKSRMEQMSALAKKITAELNRGLEGTVQTVLIEGDSKRSANDFQGRTDGNVKVIFAKEEGFNPGDYCEVKIISSNSLTLKGLVDIDKGQIKISQSQ